VAVVAGRIRDSETLADRNDTDGRYVVTSPARIRSAEN